MGKWKIQDAQWYGAIKELHVVMREWKIKDAQQKMHDWTIQHAEQTSMCLALFYTVRKCCKVRHSMAKCYKQFQKKL